MFLQESTTTSNNEWHFDSALACAYGIEEAIIIQYFQIELNINLTKTYCKKDGKIWCRKSYEDISKRLPFLSSHKIKYAIANLKKKGILDKKNFNDSPYDTTSWYSFCNEEIFLAKVGGDNE